MPGSIASGFHEGSRSEYLAQFVFSAFGTAIPVPHQEDSGIDIYCTLLERVGNIAWPRAYYSVQVKSTLDPWLFEGKESVKWIIEHPLPIFLCVVQKADARLFVYHTTPRFAAWALPKQPERLELIPRTETTGHTVDWVTGDTFTLAAPILNFTLQEALDPHFRSKVCEVLKFWIEHDVENLFRIRCGIHMFRVPVDYETNTTSFRGWTSQGGRFREESVRVAIDRLKELLGLLASHYRSKKDLESAAICAIALRHFAPGPWEQFNPHDAFLLAELNKIFGLGESAYLYQACDSLLNGVKDELAKHLKRELPSPRR